MASNATESVGLAASILGSAAYHFTQLQPHLPVYVHMLISSLFPIYAGAHASLSRPSSAAKPSKGSRSSTNDDDDDEHEEEEVESRMEGLSPGDALMFPILAAVMLTGLYVLIKWLQDPAILNKVLGWYFASFGMLGTTRLLTDLLSFGHSLVLPARYVHQGALWKLDFSARTAVPVIKETEDHVRGLEMAVTESASKMQQAGAPEERKRTEKELANRLEQLQTAKGNLQHIKTLKPRSSPLPGAFSTVSLPATAQNALWLLSSWPRRKVILKINVKHQSILSVPLTIFNIFSLVSAFAATIYFNTVAKPWYLTNLLGFSFSYGALQLMSPTTFATGALLLSALFFYDIYMVFYTPMMITVAKSLDIPIKLVFPRNVTKPGGSTHAMLGLGDIVLPGIMIGLALRFDLYMHYIRQQTFKRSRNDDGVVKTEASKAIWRPVSGKWADVFWVHRATSSVALGSKRPSTEFRKPYFHASLVGYVIGLIATIAAMHIMQHGQPALLYLVPGVLTSLGLTAVWRRESKEMWEFTEAVEEEAESNLSEKGKEIAEKAAEVKNAGQGIFSKAFFGFGAAPAEEKVKGKPKETKAKEKSKSNPDTTTITKPTTPTSPTISFSSWGSATSSASTSPVAKPLDPAKAAPSASRAQSKKGKKSDAIESDSTFFSISLSWPEHKWAQKVNWRESGVGTEGGDGPSGKRRRVEL